VSLPITVQAPRPELLHRCPGGLAPGGPEPVVIGHRGACGYRPEHTLASYALAARMGADYLSVDLVVTADAQLVGRHESELSFSTDVARRHELADLRRVRHLDGYAVQGWFADDLTLDQLRGLRAVERYPHLRHGSVLYDGLLDVPTLEEVLQLRAALVGQLGRALGLVLAVRCPDPDRRQVTTTWRLLQRHDLDRPDGPVVLASESLTVLEALRAEGARLPLAWRALAGECEPADLGRAAAVAQVVATDKQVVMPRRLDGRLGEPTGWVERAHRLGLAVHAWTFRADNVHLPTDLQIGDDPSRLGHGAREMRRFARAGVDGWATDHADRGVLARRSDEHPAVGGA
jgi:glycerophosphoryl diester phosphodiesterase